MGATQPGRLRLNGHLTVLAQPEYPGGYAGVYAHSGSGLIAFVRQVHCPLVTYLASPRARPARLTAGSQPGWQPVAAAMTQQTKGGA
jgi:hypothetical protein